MDASRFSALIAYIPVLGWIFVLFFQNRDELAMFHVRQSIGLFVFLVAVLVGWFVITWVLAWIPFAFMLGIALFTLVIAALIFGVVAWVIGIIHALQGRMVLLPVFGSLANRIGF